MAGLVLNIRKAKNASNSKPYATVKFLNIQESDLESTELKDNKIYKCTYDLSLVYPELNDEEGNFDFEKAYSIFTKELFGIEDVKCIDIPLAKVCKHNTLIKRIGGIKITNILRAYYTNEESVIENTRNYITKQLSQKALLIPDDNFSRFIIDGKERYVKLSNKICIYDNTYRAKVDKGPYVINALHNFQYGVFFRHKNNYYEIRIPFIYDSIRTCKMIHSLYDDVYWMYYFAKTTDDDEEDIVYDIYVKFLNEYSFYDDEECGTFPCLAHEVNKVVIDRRLQFISFNCQGKNGIIRNGEVFIKPQYSSIYSHRFVVDIVEDGYYKKEYKIIFVVCDKKKKGLYLENKEILPPVYDSISVEEDSGTCTLIKDNHYYIGGFKGDNNDFSMKEISEEEFFEMIDEEEKERNKNIEPGYEWTEEDAWIALTDGQCGSYPKNGVNWDLLDDFQGR